MVRLLFLVLGVALLAGCATRIDWAARVGNYTFDQVVTEIGPPDKQATLKDGTMVAEWLTRRGGTSTYIGGYYGYYSPYWCGPYYSPYISTQYPDYFLRLTFDSSGHLQAWKKFSR